MAKKTMENDLGFLEQPDKVDTNILAELKEKVDQLIDQRSRINLLEEQVKQEREKEARLSGEEIPNILLAHGITSINMESGEKIEVIEKLSASVPKEDIIKRNTVFHWLIQNGGSYLIKQELVVEEPEKAIIEFLDQKGIPYANEKKVNTNSFKAFLAAKLGMKKNTLAEIEISSVPKEASPFIYRETKITPPK